MHDSSVTTLPRTVMWRRIMDDLSFEQATLSRAPEGYEITGVILVAEAGTPPLGAPHAATIGSSSVSSMSVKRRSGNFMWRILP